MTVVDDVIARFQSGHTLTALDAWGIARAFNGREKLEKQLPRVCSAYATGDGQQLSLAIQEARELVEKVRGG